VLLHPSFHFAAKHGFIINIKLLQSCLQQSGFLPRQIADREGLAIDAVQRDGAHNEEAISAVKDSGIWNLEETFSEKQSPRLAWFDAAWNHVLKVAFFPCNLSSGSQKRRTKANSSHYAIGVIFCERNRPRWVRGTRRCVEPNERLRHLKPLEQLWRFPAHIRDQVLNFRVSSRSLSVALCLKRSLRLRGTL
jgi:hypothetical protein